MRELGDKSLSDNSKRQSVYDGTFDNGSEEYYKSRISNKPVTGVNFYRKDVKSKEITKRLAFRRIKII